MCSYWHSNWFFSSGTLGGGGAVTDRKQTFSMTWSPSEEPVLLSVGISEPLCELI